MALTTTTVSFRLGKASFASGYNSTMTGGTHIYGTNTFFANGIEDPWRWASVFTSPAPTCSAVTVKCDDCAHCVDLYTPTDQDPAALQDERKQLSLQVAQWFEN